MAAGHVIVAVLAVLMLVSACGGAPHRQAAAPSGQGATVQPVASSPGRTVVTSPPPRPAASPGRTAAGSSGTYQVGQQQVTFVEPGRIGRTGQALGPRTLVTGIWYPLAQRPAGSQPAAGPFPLIVFAPGFLQCAGPYSDLLRAWASAGYVVAAVNFPRTNCHLGAAAYEPDLVNQPADMSYVLSRLLALDAQPGNVLSGLLNRDEIAAAGQSDGGDTVAALAANGCCADHRLKTVAVLSGAEWPAMPGLYFAHGAPPMIFVQGSADTINPPWTSLQLYQADTATARYYLDLFGASHMVPYTGTNPVEQLVARVTLAFFDRYVLGQARALAAMTRDGNVSGAAALVSGGQRPPDASGQ
jgi:predicted dienelactone hydrolase